MRTEPVVVFHHTDDGTPERDWVTDPRWAVVPRLALETGRGLRLVVIIAAHPDDETLGAAGLMQHAAAAGLDTVVLVASDGEASHPGSPSHTPAALGVRRREEVTAAVRDCHPSAQLRFLGLPDGRLAAHQPAVRLALQDALGGLGAGALLVAPYAQDGHTDHDALGALARDVASTSGAALLEYPIWLWHWGTPDHLPWDALWSLPLTDDQEARKRTATGRHTSQIAPLSAEVGDEQLLSAAVQSHFERPWETFIDVGQTWSTHVFERLHRASPDPWQTTTSDYEARKRERLLALLPERRFARGFEPGCSVGVLTQALASRCDHLIGMDVSASAAAIATERCHSLPQVQIRVGSVPGDWPDGELDLVMISELGYFLDTQELDGVITRIRDSLAPDGVVALCHWRHPVDGWTLDAQTVHARVIDQLGLAALRHEEDDFIVAVLGATRDTA